MLQYWKQFLYVSLLMVLVGPFRDPFFMCDKNAIESNPAQAATAMEDYIVCVGRSEVSDPAK